VKSREAFTVFFYVAITSIKGGKKDTKTSSEKSCNGSKMSTNKQTNQKVIDEKKEEIKTI
jgi:hypothetical protein